MKHFRILTVDLLVAAAVALFIVIALALGQVEIGPALRTGTIVGFQSLSGIALWQYAIRRSSTPVFAALGVGIPIGLVLSMLVGQLTRSIPNQSFTWAIPSTLTVLVLAIWPQRATPIEVPKARELLCFVLVLTSGMVLMFRFWGEIPLHWDGWFSYYGDISVHEALASSLQAVGPSGDLLILGGSIRYHWFGDAWVGQVASLSGAEPFVTLTRTLFVTSLLACAATAWAWASSYSLRNSPRMWAGVVLFLGTTLGIGFKNPGSEVLEIFSSSFTFGAMAFLALAYILTAVLANDSKLGLFLIIGFLAFSSLGGRITFAWITFGGVAALALLAMLSRREVRATLIAGCFVAAGFILAILVIFAQKPFMGQVNNWTLTANSDAASLWGFIPFYNTLGYILGAVAVAMAVLAPATGLLYLFHLRHDSQFGKALAWAAGVLTLGFIGVFFTQQLGYAQMTLMGSGIVAVLPLSGVGFGLALNELSKVVGSRRIRIGLFVGSLIIGLSMAIAELLLWKMLFGVRFEGLGRWLSPFAPWILSIAFGMAIAYLVKRRLDYSLKINSLFVSLLVTTSCLSALVFILAALLLQDSVHGPAQSQAMTSEDLNAGEWVRNHTPEDAIFATNRLCSVYTEKAPDCAGTGFNVSGLGRRQAWIEGPTYTVGADLALRQDEFPEILSRINVSQDFGRNPSSLLHQELVSAGVKWFWVDKLLPHSADFAPYATVRFENERIKVLELR